VDRNFKKRDKGKIGWGGEPLWCMPGLGGQETRTKQRSARNGRKRGGQGTENNKRAPFEGHNA